MKARIYFIGAGPGAKDLITLRGRELLGCCEMVIYAGSLVNTELLDYTEKEAEIYDSAGMTLEDMESLFIRAREKDWKIARLHTGDPSIYGAIREQIEICEQIGLPWEVVPGVSSVFGAAAALGLEYTVPGGSQTLIISRLGKRTMVPQEENLAALARHHSSMALFLSVQDIEELVTELSLSLEKDTPVAVVYRASWPDEQILMGNLKNIAEQVKKAGINKTALILVGEAIQIKGQRSLLYDGSFSHGYRS